MANRSWGDWDGRGEGTSDHGTQHNARNEGCDIRDITGLTSVEEQMRTGGWTRVEIPCGDDPVTLVRSQLMGGGADEKGGYNAAAKAPGRFAGPPGETT